MKRNWKPFASLDKREKILRCINLVLMLGFFFASMSIMFVSVARGDYDRTFMTSIVMEVLFILPLLIELIFGRRLSNVVTICYVSYIILAGFVGSLLRVYYTFNGYDKIIHVLFGYVFSMPAIFLISLCQDYKKLNPITIALFCFFFSLSLELLWEILEFSIDRLLGQTMQGLPIEGYGAPIVTDTITDMICNTSGALLFFIHFLIGRKTKCNLGINQIEKELVYVKNTEKVQLQSEEINDTKLNGNEALNSKSFERFEQKGADEKRNELEETHNNGD